MNNRNNNAFDNIKEMIIKHVEVHPSDIAIIDETVDELIGMGIGTLKAAELAEYGTWGWALLLTDENDEVYFLSLNNYGVITQLRKDSPEGELIYALRYD